MWNKPLYTCMYMHVFQIKLPEHMMTYIFQRGECVTHMKIQEIQENIQVFG